MRDKIVFLINFILKIKKTQLAELTGFNLAGVSS